MSASGAKSGFGSVLQLSDNGGTPVYTSIAEVIEIGGIGLERTMIDVTHMLSDNAAKEYLGGLVDGDKITMKCNFTKDATQVDLYTTITDTTDTGARLATDTIRKYRIILGVTGTGFTATVSTTTWTTATHSYNTSQTVAFSTTGTLPSNVTAGRIYFARRLSSITFSIHPTEADALAGTNAISSSGGSGTHTATSGAMFKFEAGVSGIHNVVPLDDRVTADVDFKVSGLPTLT
jgi:hypothetical protein